MTDSPKKSHKVRNYVIGGVLVVGVIGALTSNTSSSDPSAQDTAQASPSTSAPVVSGYPNGTYRVGKQIQAGRYKCSGKSLKDSQGDLSVIWTSWSQAEGPKVGGEPEDGGVSSGTFMPTATVLPTDYKVQFLNCDSNWIKVK
jgi:hypothetical protein